MFHHDMIHREIPDKATLLYAWRSPLLWRYLVSRVVAAYDLFRMMEETARGPPARGRLPSDPTQKVTKKTPAFGEAAHPIVRTNHETEKCLYVSRQEDCRRGWSRKQQKVTRSRFLFDHCEQDAFVYKHQWTIDDLIVWDNRCSMHARTDFPGGERRLLFRTTVKDTQAPA